MRANNCDTAADADPELETVVTVEIWMIIKFIKLYFRSSSTLRLLRIQLNAPSFMIK